MLLQVGGCLIPECWAIIDMVFGVSTAMTKAIIALNWKY